MKQKWLTALLALALVLTAAFAVFALPAAAEGETWVASITTNGEETKYETLAAAVTAAQSGDTITLLQNITMADGVEVNKPDTTINLNLNNTIFTVNTGSNVNYRAIKITAGTLNVTGPGTMIAAGSGTTSNDGTGAYGVFRVEKDGVLNITNATLQNSRPWGLNVKVLGGSAILNNVTINSSYGGGIEVTETDLGTGSQKGSAVVTNCTFTQTGYFDHCSSALAVSGGSSLTVNGGTYTSEGQALYVFSSGGVITIDGGTFSGGKSVIRAEIDTTTYSDYTGGLQIKGGTYTGNVIITSPAYMTITGGTFSSDPTSYVALGYAVSSSTSGDTTTYSVYLPYTPPVETDPEPVDAGNVPAVVEDGKATVEVDDDTLTAITEDAETSGELTIDLTKAGSDVKTATLPASTVSKLAEAVADETSAAKSLTVALPSASVTLDAGALSTVAAAAGTDKDVSLTVDTVTKESLTTEQQALVGDALVLDLTLTVGDEKVSDFGGGTVAVTIPYTPKAGQDTKSLVVWFLSDDGTLTPCEGSYDAATGEYTFKTTHFSKYVLGYFPFTDVVSGSWYYENTVYAYTAGLMTGTSDTSFSPETGVTRAMLVTVLWRLEGKPEAADAGFTDLTQDWYKTAVNWAAANELVTGYGDGIFAPDDALTREQMVTILYRYAAYKGYDVSAAADLTAFADSGSISDWAASAAAWAVGDKVVNGSDGSFLPADGALRAQLAAVFQRFLTATAA